MQHRVSAHLPESLLTWGTVQVLDDTQPRAGEPCSLEIEVVLKQAIPAGHAIEAWVHFVSDLEMVQTEDCSADAAYTCESSGPAVELFTMPGAPVHGPKAFFPYRRYVGIRLPDGAAAGDRFVFRLARFSMQTYEETLFNLRFTVMNGDELVGYFGDAFYRVAGSTLDHLRVVIPTCVEISETVTGHIVACDRFRSKSGDDLSKLQFSVTCDGNAVGQVAYDDNDNNHRIEGLSFGEEGVYYLEVAVVGNETVCGTSNPVVVRPQWEQRVLWGETHQHTYFADGRGTPAANYEYAIRTSCLDFCSVAPHQEFTFGPPLLHLDRTKPQAGWEELVQAADDYNGDRIITILGSEAGSLGRVAGHMNSYYLDHSNRPELERIAEDKSEGHNRNYRLKDYQEFLDAIDQSTGDFLLLPHAHAGGGPDIFDLPIRDDRVTNVEVVSAHGVFDEFWHQWLLHGHRVGVHGGGDNHMTSTGNGRPGNHYPNTNGLTGATVSERSRQGVWNALRDRQTIAVSGNQRIFLEFAADGRSMGSLLPMGSGHRHLAVSVAGTSPILRVELLRNCEVIRTYRPASTTRQFLRLAWTDNICSRRVDDSHTNGTVACEGTALSVNRLIHDYNRTDCFEAVDGKINFRANGYSGITRGLVAAVDGEATELALDIRDEYAGKEVLNETIKVLLGDDHTFVSRKLDCTHGKWFTKEPQDCQFLLDVDWVDPEWPKVVSIAWEDECGEEAFYFIRVQQVDGNIAWSSPVWYRG